MSMRLDGGGRTGFPQVVVMSEQNINSADDPLPMSQHRAMTSYRAYKIGWEGRIIEVAHLDNCVDDVTAIEAAKQLAWGYVVEVWDRDRFIATLQRDASERGGSRQPD
jgi:hypothetical protein